MPRFSIRDVLWLTTLSAVLVAWLIDRQATRRHYAHAAAREARAAEREASLLELRYAADNEALRAQKQAQDLREELTRLREAVIKSGVRLNDLDNRQPPKLGKGAS